MAPAVDDPPASPAPIAEVPAPRAPALLTTVFNDTIVKIPRQVLKFVKCETCSEYPFILDEECGLPDCGHTYLQRFYKCSICDLEHKSITVIKKHVRKCNNPSDLHRTEPKQLGTLESFISESCEQWKRSRVDVEKSQQPQPPPVKDN